MRGSRCRAGGNLIAEGAVNHIIQFFLQAFQVFILTGAGLQLLNRVQILLHTIVGGTLGIHIDTLRIGLSFPCRKDYKSWHRHHDAQAHPPVEDQKADSRDDEHEHGPK